MSGQDAPPQLATTACGAKANLLYPVQEASAFPAEIVTFQLSQFSFMKKGIQIDNFSERALTGSLHRQIPEGDGPVLKTRTVFHGVLRRLFDESCPLHLL